MATDSDDWLAEYEKASRENAPSLRLVHEAQWISTAPPADDLVPESMALHGAEPTAVWTYHGLDGAPLGYVARYLEKGKKSYRQWSYGRIEGDKADRWDAKHFSKPRPLFNVHMAVANPGAQLVFVEGEKCAAAAQAVLTRQVVLTWPGGANAVKHIDLAPLQGRLAQATPKGRQAYLWPDADDPGRKAMQTIGEVLFIQGYEVMVVEVNDRPAGWDCADAIAEGISLPHFIRDNAKPYLAPRVDSILPEEPPQTPTKIHQEPPEQTGVPEIFLTEEMRLLRGKAGLEPLVPQETWRIDDWVRAGLLLKQSMPVANVSNISLVLDITHKGEIWYDEFLDQVLTWDADRVHSRQWTDDDDTMMLIHIQRTCGIYMARMSDVGRAVQAFARKDIRNQLQDWLAALEWDGIPRIDNFFHEVCTAPGTPYVSQVSRNFFISLVARAMRPGCKVDNMVVLEGPQGRGKSTMLEILGGPWYSIMRTSPSSKDFEITLKGKWLIEIAEMDSFGRSEVATVKRTLSTATDRYRNPYAVHASDHPRRSVFAGSTNQSTWLSDETGARRFWPITCGPINIRAARENRQQYFAEAMKAFEDGATWWEVNAEAAKVETDKRYEEDPWQPHIEEKLLGRLSVSTATLLDALEIPVQFQDKKAQMRVAKVLTHLGWAQKPIWDPETKKTRRVWRVL